MEIRDPVHGSIHIQKEEIPVLEHPFYQRLRSIKQLGFSEYVFPGATHTRYLHSIGVMNVVSKVFDQIMGSNHSNKDIARLRQTVRLAGLLHDIGHAPLSHTTEFVMPPIEQLGLPSKFYKPGRKANHEDYTVKSIIDSSFTESFTSIQKTFGVELERVADLVVGNTHEESYYTIDGINYFPLLHQLVSSEMDCDRMDYLLRDSYFCGVSYGKFDLDWIIDNLSACTIEGKAYLGLSERAVATFDDFLLCRFHMFLMVYFHYKAVALEKLLKRYFESAPSEYKIPANIEEYLNHDDHYLMKVLRNSENIWAKRIVRNNIPRKIFETFGQSQHAQLARLEQYLTANNIDFIKCSSSGRLSKYYQNSSAIIKYPLKVIRESNIASASVQYMDINQATDLFDKFSKAHSVDRIHCDFDELDSLHQNEIIKIITTQ